MAFKLFSWKWKNPLPLAFTCLCQLQLFIENSESLEMHIFSGGGKLQIARSQVSNSGTYTCVASNVEGNARKSYHLTIQGICKHMCMYAAALCLSRCWRDCSNVRISLLVPPSISGSELPREVGVLLNESIQLVCQATGNPTPTLQWLKDGEAINHTSSSELR